MSKKSGRLGPPKIKIIIDTNLWISFIISSRLEEIVSLLLKGNIVIYTCQELIYELEEVLQRDKIRRYLKMPVGEYISFHKENSNQITIKSNSIFEGDPKDSFLLDLSLATKSNFLVTGDKVLLSLGKFATTRIISFTEFKKLMS